MCLATKTLADAIAPIKTRRLVNTSPTVSFSKIICRRNAPDSFKVDAVRVAGRERIPGRESTLPQVSGSPVRAACGRHGPVASTSGVIQPRPRSIMKLFFLETHPTLARSLHSSPARWIGRRLSNAAGTPERVAIFKARLSHECVGPSLIPMSIYGIRRNFVIRGSMAWPH